MALYLVVRITKRATDWMFLKYIPYTKINEKIRDINV